VNFSFFFRQNSYVMELQIIKFIAKLLLISAAGCSLSGQTPREEFRQLVAQLAQSPKDDALREKVIQAGATIDPPPAIPEEARHQFIVGKTLRADAKNQKEAQLAIETFQKAEGIAPWWGDVYLEISVTQEMAGKLEDAGKSLHFYVLSMPGEEKARLAQDHIYELEAKSRRNAAESQRSQEDIEARKRLTGWWQFKDSNGQWVFLQADGYSFTAVPGMSDDSWSFQGKFDGDMLKGLYTRKGHGEGNCKVPDQSHDLIGYLENESRQIRFKTAETEYHVRTHETPSLLIIFTDTVCDSVSPLSTNPKEFVLNQGPVRSYLGVLLRDFTEEQGNSEKGAFARCMKLEKVATGGGLIERLDPSGIAAQGGMQAGDAIVEATHMHPLYGGKKLYADKDVTLCSARDVQTFVGNTKPGQTIRVKFLRNEGGRYKEKEVRLIIGARPVNEVPTVERQVTQPEEVKSPSLGERVAPIASRDKSAEIADGPEKPATGKADSNLTSAEVHLPSDGKAIVYVYREGHFVGGAVSWWLFLENSRIARISNGSYLIMEIEPGNHALNIDTGPILRLEVKPGAVVFIRAFLPNAFSKHFSLSAVTQTEGSESIHKLKYLKRSYIADSRVRSGPAGEK